MSPALDLYDVIRSDTDEDPRGYRKGFETRVGGRKVFLKDWTIIH